MDEIHRMPPGVEEILYPAMEDFKLDLIIARAGARTVKIDLEPFTLVGHHPARAAHLAPARPLRGHRPAGFLRPGGMARIVLRAARIIGAEVTAEARRWWGRAPGAPRHRQPAAAAGAGLRPGARAGVVDGGLAEAALARMDVDEEGLDQMDARSGRCSSATTRAPGGGETLAVACSEEVRTLETIYEPYSSSGGFLKRTSRGRVATAKAFAHMKAQAAAAGNGQGNLI